MSFTWGFEEVTSYFEKIAITCTEFVKFESPSLRRLELAQDSMFRTSFDIIVKMNNLEILQKALKLLSEIIETENCAGWSDSPTRQLSLNSKKNLEEFQKISIRVEKVLSQLGIYTVVSAYGRTFDVVKQSASDGDIMMVNLVIPLIRQAEGFLLDPGHLGESFKFNSGIDDDVQYRFMTGDYGGAVAKSFKIFKSKLHTCAGTDDVDVAIAGQRADDQLVDQAAGRDHQHRQEQKGAIHRLAFYSRCHSMGCFVASLLVFNALFAELLGQDLEPVRVELPELREQRRAARAEEERGCLGHVFER